MRTLAAMFFVVACFAVGATNAHADEAAEIEAVKTAFAALVSAFERQDSDDIKRRMTADHVAVTPYYGKPQSVADQIRSLPDLKNFKETPVSKIKVTLLAAEAALITYLADNEGTFKGRPVRRRVFVLAIWVKRGGKWFEKVYQVTAQKS